MAFVPIQYDSGQMVELGVDATTFTKGDAIVANKTSGYYKKAAVGDGQEVTHVIMETVASAATAGDKHLFLRVRDVVFEADCDGVVSLADIGETVDMGAAGTLNPDSGSTDYIFYIEDIIGVAETSTKVRGWFVQSTPHAAG